MEQNDKPDYNPSRMPNENPEDLDPIVFGVILFILAALLIGAWWAAGILLTNGYNSAGGLLNAR